jgi:hypothetical protein
MATSFPMPESPKKQGQPLITLDTLTTRLQHYSARRLPGRNWVARCGVILLIAEHGISGYSSEPALLDRKDLYQLCQ